MTDDTMAALMRRTILDMAFLLARYGEGESEILRMVPPILEDECRSVIADGAYQRRVA